MKRVFVRSALLDEHFYALTDGDKLYGDDGKELHESFIEVKNIDLSINLLHIINAVLFMVLVMGISALVYFVCYVPSFYSLVVSLCEVCNA